MEYVKEINAVVNRFIWGRGMLAVFLFVGVMFTVRTGFFQFTKVRIWLGENNRGDVSGQACAQDRRGTFYLSVSVFLYGACSNTWNREYHRCGSSIDCRRTGSYFLDVGICVFGDDDNLCGKSSGDTVSL